MYRQLHVFAGIAVMVLLGSVLVALVLSSRLQRPISQPILALAEIARLIAQDKDYTVRVPSLGRDETGQLSDALNQLLASIEERDRALRAANESLRQEIADKKSAEERDYSRHQRAAGFKKHFSSRDPHFGGTPANRLQLHMPLRTGCQRAERHQRRHPE